MNTTLVWDDRGAAPDDVLRQEEIDGHANRSIRKASITAGVGLLVMSALSGFGYLFAVKGLVTQGNAARTARDIVAHETLFNAVSATRLQQTPASEQWMTPLMRSPQQP
jgi:hypothetical protein